MTVLSTAFFARVMDWRHKTCVRRHILLALFRSYVADGGFVVVAFVVVAFEVVAA